MDEIKKGIEAMQECIDEMYAELDIAEQKGFVYNRAKNIRKAAQQLKVEAHSLRATTTEEFNKAKANK